MEIEARAGDNICDFCSEPNPSRLFASPDFRMDGPRPEAGLPEYRSKGGWAACSTCASMIDNGAWDRLLVRGIDAMVKKYGSLMPKRMLADTVQRSHSLFREHYFGGKQ
jgi:hypothetical protein